jgi:hypothetical protein
MTRKPQSQITVRLKIRPDGSCKIAVRIRLRLAE